MRNCCTTAAMQKDHPKIQQFRIQLCTCFTKRAGASFNLIDALASAVKVESPVELSQSPVFERKFASVYDALTESKLDHDAQHTLFCGWQVDGAQTISGYQVFACDSTKNPRPEADCLPDRVWLKSDSDTPAVAGQEYACVVQVLHERTSWVKPLELERVPSNTTASTLAAQQVLRVHQQSPNTPKVVAADSRYANRVFLAVFVGILTLCALVRMRNNMVLHATPPKRKARQRGRPRTHGARFSLKSARKRTCCDREDTFQLLGQSVHLRAWHDLHFRWLCALVGTVVCVEFLLPDGTPRYKNPMWLFWSGPISVPLADLCRMYLWRFAIEHFFRFIKQHLGFYATRTSFLECTERWIDIVTLAYWQILLAAPHLSGYVAPWRTMPKPNLPFTFASTPRQVQLALPAFLAVIGTPAPPTGPAGKSPGRPLGFKPPLRPHLKPVRKSPSPAKSRRNHKT